MTRSLTRVQSTSQHSEISCVAAAACARGLRWRPPTLMGISMPPCTGVRRACTVTSTSRGFCAAKSCGGQRHTITVGSIILTSGLCARSKLGDVSQRLADLAVVAALTCTSNIQTTRLWNHRKAIGLRAAAKTARLGSSKQLSNKFGRTRTWKKPFDLGAFEHYLIEFSDVAVVSNGAHALHPLAKRVQQSVCSKVSERFFHGGAERCKRGE